MDLVFAPSEIETWPIDRLRPYARNAKVHGDDQVAKMVLPDEFELVSIWTETLTLMLCRDRATRRGRRRGFA